MVPPMSRSPATTSSWSAMVEMTGCLVSGSNSAELASVDAGQVAGRLDDHALHAEADAEQRDLVLPGVPDRADLALDAAHAEPAGDQHAVDAVELALGALGASRSRRS